jgi:hypothetical protein
MAGMIEVKREVEDATVFVGGIEAEINEFDENGVFAECDLNQLGKETNSKYPSGLTLTIHGKDGFGTGLFHEADLVGQDDQLVLHFNCLHPNKYWEGRFGLATFLEPVASQVPQHDKFKIVEKNLSEDWKQLVLETAVPKDAVIQACIQTAADEIKQIIHEANVALTGIVWRREFKTDESLFCTDVLLPLFRRMGFLTVRYRHGVKEYGKDFTFSELHLFGGLRHYGVQAKAGNVSGGVNAAIDEIIGQIGDAFAMPYYEVGSKDPQCISTFVIAISGVFTDNAKDKIAEKIPKGLIGSIVFLDRELIVELIERYWRQD